MTRIRRLEIRNFRSIQTLDWAPSNGVNCLIGPGDSGKSTILDAIDLCLGARRSAPFGDTDFFGLDVTRTIVIAVTLGALPDALKNIDTYGEFLRGFDLSTGGLEDEPRAGIETVLTLRLEVKDDLEPSWMLYSERAAQQQLERSLAWKDRSLLAPARIGTYASTSLSWARGSVLNRLTEERANLGSELAGAARAARSTFGAQAGPQLAQTLQVVTQTATNLGVAVGASAQALLDAHSVSIGDGAIALHSEAGIPLRSLGTGSGRLLVAGLQRAAAAAASVALVDEVEYGLEPHRLMRLLDSLGAKDETQPLQVFMTTHSPVTLKELAANQLFVVRQRSGIHSATCAHIVDDIQGTLRKAPEAFLSKSVIVCEGASEVGFARGIDQWWVQCGATSFLAHGGSYVDAGGGSPDQCFTRGEAFLKLGYRVLVFVDADKPVSTVGLINRFVAAGGQYITWRTGLALEDELFQHSSNDAVHMLLNKADAMVGRELMAEHVKSKSNGQVTLDAIEAERLNGGYTPVSRALLGLAARNNKNGWFKSVSSFQEIAKDIVGPHLSYAERGFVQIVGQLWGWTSAAA
ncbi:ATP-dependent nuclease [Chromobacterium violaceum]|uniref:Recombination protein F n=1 Tax=Chromobacterium violaceum TaxID=536 RepID=A0AAX2M634_CHRVL|nr:ATP-binding protein [Chromobacterium violaceum]OLZ79847.1 ATP-dependent endonuclease [Chromobacterium violaceum]STB64256.1 recombination protein F [Chromobacterium violaceum]SUX31968.1 recombination protein F [Chromobacterium violaceum]